MRAGRTEQMMRIGLCGHAAWRSGGQAANTRQPALAVHLLRAERQFVMLQL